MTKREENQVSTVTWHIAINLGNQRALLATPSGHLLEKIEHAKVEHPFHVLKNLFRHRKTRYRGPATNIAQLLTLFGKGSLMMAKKRLIELHAQGGS